MTILGHVVTKGKMKTKIKKAVLINHVNCLSSVLVCFPYFILFNGMGLF